MKKVVLKVDFVDEKIKQKIMKSASGISGVESITLDPKDKKLAVTGDIDPVSVVAKLRKLCHTEIVSVGPAKEPEKKKEEPKKEEPKKKEDPKVDPAQLMKAYQAYYQGPHYYHHQNQPQYRPYQQAYYNRSVEEDPNGCVIC